MRDMVIKRTMKPRILIVDDETRMCRSLQILLLGESKYDVSFALSGEHAIKYITEEETDLLIEVGRAIATLS